MSVRDDEPDATLSRLHAGNNRRTRKRWTQYEVHREALMRLIGEDGGHRVVVLGAGNCNDIELATVARRFEEVHLVDIDPGAVRRATRALDRAARERVHVHAADLSGCGGELARWRDRMPPLAELRCHFEGLPASLSVQLGGPFDRVVSSGVLSQLVWACAEALGPHHPAFGLLAEIVVTFHVRTVVALTGQGGRFAMANDCLVVPASTELEGEALMARLARAEAAGEHIPSTSIAHVVGAFQKCAPDIEIGLTPPWLWRIAADRAHVTYGLTGAR